MPHTLSKAEANALHYLALALRNDWTHNRPGPKWKNKLDTWPSIPHAENFLHTVEALTAYATMAADDGTHVKRTPDFFILDGRHWDTTRPTEAQFKSPPCEEHDYGDNTKENCGPCRSEILTGQRPYGYLGEIYNPTPTESDPTVGQPPQTAPNSPNHTTQTTPASPEQGENRGTTDAGHEPE